jgi:sec-independent protein translocase protein TatA
MFGIGHWELIVIAAVIMLLFGPSMLPKLARSIGDSVKAFRTSAKEVEDALDGVDDSKGKKR